MIGPILPAPRAQGAKIGKAAAQQGGEQRRHRRVFKLGQDLRRPTAQQGRVAAETGPQLLESGLAHFCQSRHDLRGNFLATVQGQRRCQIRGRFFGRQGGQGRHRLDLNIQPPIPIEKFFLIPDNVFAATGHQRAQNRNRLTRIEAHQAVDGGGLYIGAGIAGEARQQRRDRRRIGQPAQRHGGINAHIFVFIAQCRDNRRHRRIFVEGAVLPHLPEGDNRGATLRTVAACKGQAQRI